MEYDEKALTLCALCIIFGCIFLIIGVITSEIEINKYKCEELYGESNCNR